MGNLQTLLIILPSDYVDIACSEGGPIFGFINLRAARLPATNNGYRQWKAGAEPVSRTEVAVVVIRTEVAATVAPPIASGEAAAVTAAEVAATKVAGSATMEAATAVTSTTPVTSTTSVTST